MQQSSSVILSIVQVGFTWIKYSIPIALQRTPNPKLPNCITSTAMNQTQQSSSPIPPPKEPSIRPKERRKIVVQQHLRSTQLCVHSSITIPTHIPRTCVPNRLNCEQLAEIVLKAWESFLWSNLSTNRLTQNTASLRKKRNFKRSPQKERNIITEPGWHRWCYRNQQSDGSCAKS